MAAPALRDGPAGAPADASVGLVAIGRNEGDRLRACLARARELADAGIVGPIIYVDSGSTDGSVAAAEALGVRVVELDTSRGFTAGRARNAGAEALLAHDAPPAFVQFVDGDCVLDRNWIGIGVSALLADPGLAAVAGRTREAHPDATLFNRLCDMEWNTPVGDAKAVGGIALYRTGAFAAVNGFDPAFICGEERELGRRLRARGWRIERIDAEMTLHDAAMTRLGQWRRRTERTGWAFAEGADRFGAEPDRFNMREMRRILLWGVAVPAAALLAAALAAVLPGWRAPLAAVAAVGLLAYPLMAVRIARRRRAQFGDPWRHGLLYGAFAMLGKPFEALGALRYRRSRARGEEARIIEYKEVPDRPGET